MTHVDPPIVSIGVITYNHEKFIKQCLDGILMQQTNFRFEVVIGEDCSTDSTKQIIKSYEAAYPNIIKPVYQEKNVGAARNAFEFCYPKLTGKYIAICEGDDYWTDPLKLQKQVDFLEQHPHISMTFHKANHVNGSGDIIELKKPSGKVTVYDWKKAFHLNVPTMSIVFRNYCFVVPPEVIKANFGDAFVRGLLATRGGAADLGFIGAHYRIHPNGIYSSLKVIDQFRYSLRIRKGMKNSNLFNSAQKVEIKKELLRRRVLYMLYFIKKKQFRNFLKIAFA